MTDLRVQDTVLTSNDENINILLNNIDTEINIEYLLSKLASKEYKVIIDD